MRSVVFDHSFRRKAEPYFWKKGVSAEVDQLGTEPPYVFSGDSDVRVKFSFSDLLDGGGCIRRPYDQVIVFGQAGSHCVPRVIIDGVNDLENKGRQHLARRIVYLPGFCQTIPGFEKQRLELEQLIEVMGVQVLWDAEKVFM